MASRRFVIALGLTPMLFLSLALADGEDCRADADCGVNEFCSYLLASCLSDAPFGRCVFVHPDAGCTHLYMPVCGCDLQTYPNGCEASLDYVSLISPGECEPCSAASFNSCTEGRICQVERSACSAAYEGTCVPPRGQQLVHLVFEGTVGDAFDGLGLLPGVGAGDRFHGSFTYDLSTPDTGWVGEGQRGIYEHLAPPAGIRLVVGDLVARSAPGSPAFVVNVDNEAGFAGADAITVNSGRTVVDTQGFAAELATTLSWTLLEFVGSPLFNVALPPCPPDLTQFEINDLQLRAECVPCLGPAAFIEVDGALDLLEHALILNVEPSELQWSTQPGAAGYDVVAGSIGTLGSFDVVCLADDTGSNTLVLGPDPLPGEGRWFLVRPERAGGPGTWDGHGLRQDGPRDPAIANCN